MTLYTTIGKQETMLMLIENESERVRERERGRKKIGESNPDETNSKRDVLLIILTPGVRLNERRSQTRQARCKFNYREEMGGERRARKEKR